MSTLNETLQQQTVKLPQVGSAEITRRRKTNVIVGAILIVLACLMFTAMSQVFNALVQQMLIARLGRVAGSEQWSAWSLLAYGFEGLYYLLLLALLVSGIREYRMADR